MSVARALRARVTRSAVAFGCVLLAACGVTTNRSHSGSSISATQSRSVPDGDWTTFGYDAQRTGVDPSSSGIRRGNLSRLKMRIVHIAGVADSAPIQAHAIKVEGHVRDVDVVTTTYGRTIAFDPATGKRLWQYAPHEIRHYLGSPQITTATPVLDPDRRYVYAATPDGFIHKLALATGHELWKAHVTFNAPRQKIEGALNISGHYVVAATGGYIGDQPVYQGHVALIGRSNGHTEHVWNALCSDRHRVLHLPSSCPASDAAIWGRAGAVVEPGSRRLLVATGNAPFNGHTNWGDSVLELSPSAGRLLHNWTPKDQAKLNADDQDLGSTAPALFLGTSLAVQGGKAGKLDLLNLKRLDGTTGGPGSKTGGQLQSVASPGSQPVFTAPLTFKHKNGHYLVVADYQAIAGYKLSGRRLHQVWLQHVGGSSPVMAGGLMFVFDPSAGKLRVMDPVTGKIMLTRDAAAGHWSSPIVTGGRIVLPVGGSATDNATSGKVLIYHLPGR